MVDSGLDSAAAARESPASAATAGVAGDSSDMMRSCRGARIGSQILLQLRDNNREMGCERSGR